MAKVFSAEIEVGRESKLWLWSFHLVDFLWKMSRLSLGMLMEYIRSKGLLIISGKGMRKGLSC